MVAPLIVLGAIFFLIAFIQIVQRRPRFHLPKFFTRVAQWFSHKRFLTRDNMWEMGRMDMEPGRKSISIKERTDRNEFAKQWRTHPTLSKREAKKIKRRIRRDQSSA